MLKIYVKHGMIVEIIHEINSFKQSKCLKKFKNFNTQKRKKAKTEFEKDFYILINNAFYGKAMENVRNRLELEFIKKDEFKKNYKTTI